MSWYSAWLSRLRNHFRSDRVSREIEREMAFHLEERVDDLVASGMRHDAARYEARRRFGNVGLHRERTRNRDLFASLDILLADLRYALRSLRAAPAFAFVAILSLALGIGANTAIFTILNAVLLKSLPVSHPEELVAVTRNGDRGSYTNPLWEAIRDRQDMFSGVFAFGGTNFNLTNGGEARRIDASWVSGDYFSTLGVQAVAGRTITRADDYRGCPGVAVLGHGFWQTAYGGDARAIGKTISFSGKPFVIVGVADPRFFGVEVGDRPQAYVPLCARTILLGPKALDGRSNWFLHIVGRPKPNLSPEQVRARFTTIAPAIIEATLPPDWPAEATARYKKAPFGVEPAANGFSDLRLTYKKALYILMAIAGLVLLVACANVANLLLARATARRHEVAVRLALGAGRGRIARQLVTESLLLSSIGAIVGVGFAMWGSRVLVTLLSHGKQTVELDLVADTSMLLFTIVVAVVTGLLFGLAPAWQAGRVDPQTAMKAQGRGVAEGQSRFSVGQSLVVAQVALSLVLIAGAGLLLGSWRRLATVDPGFRRDQILLVSTDIRTASTTPEERTGLFTQILERVQSLPGVRAASASAVTPVGMSAWNDVLKVEGFTAKSEDDAVSWMNAVSDDYFATLGIPLLAGRAFDNRETPTSAKVAIVNEAMARHFFGTANAIGKRFQVEDGSKFGPPIEVIGIAATTKYRSLRDSAQPIVYYARSQETAPGPYLEFEVRTDGPPLALIPSVKAALAELSPRITLDFTTLDQQLAESLTLNRTIATLSGFFGGLALLLATIGLYGIMAYNVARRRNEIGVRIALGAEQSRVIRMVLGDVGRIVLIGIVLGVALSLGATRLVSAFLYGMKPNDPLTLGASAFVLLAVGIGAAALPAWRAARLDPVAALREE